MYTEQQLVENKRTVELLDRDLETLKRVKSMVYDSFEEIRTLLFSLKAEDYGNKYSLQYTVCGYCKDFLLNAMLSINKLAAVNIGLKDKLNNYPEGFSDLKEWNEFCDTKIERSITDTDNK